MNGHVRLYRVLLVAYPKQHRSEYGDAMAQLARDRLCDEGGGVRTARIWAALLSDLATSAARERMESSMQAFKSGWWRFAAVLIATVLAAAGVRALFEPAEGAWYQWTLGRGALLAAPVLIVAGLIVRRRHRRNGSILVAVGLLPGAAAIVLFWWPPFLLFGVFSIGAIIGAINDADAADRIGRIASVGTPSA